MKKALLLLMLVLVVVSVFGSCATATAVPPNATDKQIEFVNAKNLESIATNISTTTQIQIAGIISGFVLAFVGLAGASSL